MKVLIACERSGVMRRAFRSLGHDAWSCDLEEPDDGSEFHYCADALRVARESAWDLVVAHPVCTYLCNSGVRWLSTEPERWKRMIDGAVFFREFLELRNARHVAVENPVMHRYGRLIVGRAPDFTVQPWMFGDNEKKRTCWWVRDLPKLKATSVLDGLTAQDSIHRAPPGPDRARFRSQTFPGMAMACAKQWGGYVEARAAA